MTALRREREAQGLTVRQLAYFADTAPSTVSRIERGLIVDPTPAVLARIANALRVEVQELYPRRAGA